MTFFTFLLAILVVIILEAGLASWKSELDLEPLLVRRAMDHPIHCWDFRQTASKPSSLISLIVVRESKRL
jgi:hypothetical protein